jgi:hypothetical protein
MEQVALERPHPSTDDLMIVLCSERNPGTELAASLRPRVVLELLGGACIASDGAVRATFEYGIRVAGVRRVLLFAHAGCFAAGSEGAPAWEAAVAQGRALLRDERIAPLLRSRGVRLGAGWFDSKPRAVDLVAPRQPLADGEGLDAWLLRRSGDYP